MVTAIITFIAIVIGALWVLAKVLQAIAGYVDQARTNHSAAAAKRKQDQYLRSRDSLRQFVHFLIPDELQDCEKKLDRERARFEQAQRAAEFVAGPPAWKRVEFKPLVAPIKENAYHEMSLDDIEQILTPSPDKSTWSYEESQIVSRRCKYPSAPPAGHLEEFTMFPTFGIDLKQAVFATDGSRISKKDVTKYFADEHTQTTKYNNQRADLLEKIIGLNSRIQEWNRSNQLLWEAHVSRSKQMENAALLDYQRAAEQYAKACREEVTGFERLREGYTKSEKRCVVERFGFVLDRIRLPGSVPHTWDIDFDEEQQIVVIDVGLPDVVHRPPHKIVVLKSGAVAKPLNQTERKEFIPKVHPAILLRTAYDVFRNDADETIKLLVVNGWVQFDDPATGLNTKAYTASLMVKKEQIASLNLTKIDPVVAFNNLHGKSAGRLVEIIPIEPMLSLNRKDSRFVDAKDVLKSLGTETNLAAMDWQDFEHLIRELFEKEFSGRGAEVKVTQASRDRGVDAIVFDPDPIRGGKYIIQAKRYTNTVDVSAVRDLCAVVQKEGASRGILVTTSTYGADAYAFANNEPVTLLNGAELLGLLKKHGYGFRINLEEARRST